MGCRWQHFESIQGVHTVAIIIVVQRTVLKIDIVYLALTMSQKQAKHLAYTIRFVSPNPKR